MATKTAAKSTTKSTTKSTAKAKAPAKTKAKATTTKTTKAPAKPKAKATTAKTTKAPAKAKKPAAKKSAAITTIKAMVDVGWGNSLFIRGNGAGLEWETGKQMDWVDGSWTWSSTSVNGSGLEFKFLINDEVWAEGENGLVASGETSVSTPSF